MKKLLTILIFVLLAFSGFSQRRTSIPWLTSQDITNTRYFIYRGDTIDFTSIVDSLYLSWSDSITGYVTPKQLMDSIATLAGGHDPVTAGTSAIAGGLGVTGQELSFQKAKSSQSGYLDKDDFTAFYNKLSSVTHGLHFTGLGTGASPLRLDTGYVRSWLNPIYLSPTGDLIGTFFGLDTTYLLNYNNHLNTPTISDAVFGITWDANSDLATKNSIYDALVSVSGIVTDLTYSPYSDKGIMNSSTGAGDTIPVVDTTYAGLITPLDKERLDGVVSLTLTDGLKEGGNVTWTGGLNFAITPAVYYISLTRYESTHETATLDAADTLNRIDVLALDTLKQVVILKGTPSANPQKPTIDPQAHIELTNVLLLAGDTIPSQTTGDSITNVIVYDENLEWTTSATGVVVDFAYPTSPYKGDSCVSVGTIGRGDYLAFAGSDTLLYEDYETISLWIKLKAAMPTVHDLRVELYLGTAGLGSAIAAVDKTYLGWQNIVIKIDDFEKIYTSFNELRIYYQVKTGATTAGFYIDDFIIQAGITQPAVTEYQTISTNNTPGNISISKGNTIILNVNDADADSTNELQTISLDGEHLVLSKGNTIDLGLIISDSTNYWSKDEITTTDTTRWGTLQTATTVSYSPVTSTLTAVTVQAAIDELEDEIDTIVAAGGADNWGSQNVVTDATLTGVGTVGSPLSVVQPTGIGYGYLYNWYAATDTNKITSSDDWIVPEYDDFTVLCEYVGDSITPLSYSNGQKLKYDGLEYWYSEIIGTNDYGFNAKGSGHRYYFNGAFYDFGYYATYLSITETERAAYKIDLYDDGEIFKILLVDLFEKTDGGSIRLVYTGTGTPTSYTGNDGKVYPVVLIGTQYWLAENLAETEYRNGDPIPIVTDNTEWAALSSGARCSYDNDESIALTTVDYLTTEVDGSITNELITSVAYSSDTLTITEAGTEHKVEIAVGSTEVTLTGEVTGTGTGTVSTIVADNTIDYANVDETLKDSLVNNTLAWDMSSAGIIYCTPSTGTVSFTNKQKNKQVVVVLTLSSATITWPTEAKILDGSATLGDGTFFVFIQCISDTIVLVSITKAAS